MKYTVTSPPLPDQPRCTSHHRDGRREEGVVPVGKHRTSFSLLSKTSGAVILSGGREAPGAKDPARASWELVRRKACAGRVPAQDEGGPFATLRASSSRHRGFLEMQRMGCAFSPH